METATHESVRSWLHWSVVLETWYLQLDPECIHLADGCGAVGLEVERSGPGRLTMCLAGVCEEKGVQGVPLRQRANG